MLYQLWSGLEYLRNNSQVYVDVTNFSLVLLHVVVVCRILTNMLKFCKFSRALSKLVNQENGIEKHNVTENFNFKTLNKTSFGNPLSYCPYT